tara:strand:- start:1162 stop:1500 length:339 start_codon:yes stop_codon:yes gene_type:complete
MKIKYERLLQIIKEEARLTIERIQSIDAFPKPDLPGYSKSRPDSGIIALNTKLNSLITAVMVMNDTAASTSDLNNLRDEIAGEDIRYKKGTGDIEAVDDTNDGIQVASPDDR